MDNENGRAKESTIHDLRIKRGEGGELHQTAKREGPVTTTAFGTPISDDQNSLKAGSRGPTLMEDFHFRDKMFHFDHERIPERVVHARGYGAHGYFENYESLADITCADLFQRPGERTPLFVRFSTVVGNKGSFDLARDVRGFAVKMYTKEGNWDLVGNNIPVFFIQDAMRFPDLVHAVKQEPDRGFPQATAAHDNFWDFISLMPESMHMIMWVMSDRAIPRSYRFMEGFGVHTFRFVNDQGKSTFVKFHWKPKLGLQSVVWNEAVKINGADPDFHRRDLWNAIKSGDFPEWELHVQLFDQEFADRFDFDVLDPTKIIPEETLPTQPIGRMVLDRMPDNFFMDTEQVAFMTQNVPPGIDFSNDPLLQGRNFSYLDTQLKRLGSTNFSHLPINAPKCPMHHFQQDGHMAFRNPSGRANYQPNSWGEGPRESLERGHVSYPENIDGQKVRVRPQSFADHYSQARQFYISQTETEQNHIISALTFEISKVQTQAIRLRMVSHLLNIDEEMANKVAMKLGLMTMPKPADAAVQTRMDLPPSAALSVMKNGPDNIQGRKIGILVTDGVDLPFLQTLKELVKSKGATVEIVAPTIGGVTSSDGTRIEADHNIEGGPSVLFDAVVLFTSAGEGAKLATDATALEFVMDAFAHCKFIGYVQGAMLLLQQANIAAMMDEGVVAIDEQSSLADFLDRCRKLRLWEREAKVRTVP